MINILSPLAIATPFKLSIVTPPATPVFVRPQFRIDRIGTVVIARQENQRIDREGTQRIERE